jgi:hypothetical protein
MTTTYPNADFAIADLQLGDIIDFGFAPWGSAIICKIDENNAHFFRPYGLTADFECGGGVICYTGIENGTLWRQSSAKIRVLQRQELR